MFPAMRSRWQAFHRERIVKRVGEFAEIVERLDMNLEPGIAKIRYCEKLALRVSTQSRRLFELRRELIDGFGRKMGCFRFFERLASFFAKAFDKNVDTGYDLFAVGLFAQF
jgi:hypothetical protein